MESDPFGASHLRMTPKAARLRMTAKGRAPQDDSLGQDPTGSAKATYVPPDGASFLPPPHAMTMNARPFTT